MFRELKLSVGFGLVLSGIMANAQSLPTITDLDPFTHVALIPAESDLTSIRFQSVKLVRIPTKSRSITADSYCQQQAFREPGGSLYCPQTQLEMKVPAYQVTYSYAARPMMSDEYAGTSFTLSVYYRPEELSSVMRQAISQGKGRDSDVAAFFDAKTSRMSEQRTAIDLQNSTFCGGNLIDGIWSRVQSRCTDEIKYKAVTVAANSVAVRIDPSSPKLSLR